MSFLDDIGDIFESDPEETKTVSQSSYSGEITGAGKTALNRATEISARPFTGYNPKDRVPDLVSRYSNAFGLIDSKAGKWQPDVNTSKDVARGYATGATGIYDSIDKFKTPYLDDVLGRTEAGINRSYDVASRRQDQQLVANAGSGSSRTANARAGLVKAQMEKDRAGAIADATATISQQAYDKAAQMSATDAQARRDSANQLVAMLGQEMNMDTTDLNRMLAAAGTEQGRADLLADAKFQEFIRQQGWDTNQINTFISQIATIAPMLGTTGTQTSTYDPGGNDLMRWAGLGVAAAGALTPGGSVSGNPGAPASRGPAPLPYLPAYAATPTNTAMLNNSSYFS